jgi:hypothetical protein
MSDCESQPKVFSGLFGGSVPVFPAAFWADFGNIPLQPLNPARLIQGHPWRREPDFRFIEAKRRARVSRVAFFAPAMRPRRGYFGL